MKTHLLIPTAGRSELLGRLLDSLFDSEAPASLESIVVIENGERCGAEGVCEWAGSRLPLKYLWSPKPGKSLALNAALEALDEDSFAIMTDDDVRFEPQTLRAYECEAEVAGPGWYFGGPFGADFESAPPEWLMKYLPPSAKGWSPTPRGFRPAQDRFYGCNWGAWVSDLRAIGGFDARYGPGSADNATGQENDAQRRLLSIGCRPRYVKHAKVWHWVPASRCSPAWAIARSRRNGRARGITHRSRHVGRIAANHTLNAFRYTTATALGGVAALGGPRLRFQADYHRHKAAGYFAGFFARDPESLSAA